MKEKSFIRIDAEDNCRQEEEQIVYGLRAGGV